MRVKAEVVAVEHAAAQVGEVDLRNALELFGDGGVGVLHRGGVLLRRHFQDVGTLHGFQPRLTPNTS